MRKRKGRRSLRETETGSHDLGFKEGMTEMTNLSIESILTPSFCAKYSYPIVCHLVQSIPPQSKIVGTSPSSGPAIAYETFNGP